ATAQRSEINAHEPTATTTGREPWTTGHGPWSGGPPRRGGRASARSRAAPARPGAALDRVPSPPLHSTPRGSGGNFGAPPGRRPPGARTWTGGHADRRKRGRAGTV